MRTTSLIAVLLATLLVAGHTGKAHAGVFISVTVAPPALPVYVQPPIPAPGYMWSPGYWAWEEEAADYYWVPGAWVPAPEPGLLWTPGYWGWSNGYYVWNDGYWGPHVGFYGGVNYGYGYGGAGFEGGRWQGGVFAYNRSVMNVGVGVTVTLYSKTVIAGPRTYVSFNGGNGGVMARPTPRELEVARERHLPASGEQFKHQQLARANPGLRAAKNHGKPAIAAVGRAGDFSKHNSVAAKSAGGFKPQGRGTPVNRNASLALSQNRGSADRRTTRANPGQNPPKRAAVNTQRRPGPPKPPPARPVAQKPPPKRP